MTADVDLDAFFGARPRIREDLLISPAVIRGPDRIHLLKVRGGTVFEVSPKEHFLISRLDGRRSLAEIGQEYADEYHRRLGTSHWSQLLWQLQQRELLAEPGRERPPVPPGRMLRRVTAGASWLFTRPAAAAIVVGLLVMYAAVVAQATSLWSAALPALGDWRSLAGIVAFTYVSGMLHELGHAVAAVRFGCSDIRINLMILSCRAEDYQFLESRRRQMVIAAAGGVVNSLVVLPFAIAWFSGWASNAFVAAVVLVGSVQALVNFVPLSPLDGYKIVSHLAGAVSLARESRRFVWSRVRRWFGREAPEYAPPSRIVLAAYGVAWHLLVGFTVVAGVVVIGGLLDSRLGRAGYGMAAAVAVVVLSFWFAAQRRLPRRIGAQPTSERARDARSRH